MRQISPKAVIVGSLFDIIATQLLMFVLILAICVPMMSGSTGRFDAAQIRTALEHSTLFKVGGWIIGALVSIVAGYVAAAIAKRGELINGALSAVLCVALGLYALLSGTASHSPLMVAIDFAGSPLLGLLGGYLRAKRMAPARAT